jgi:hypothetical protein
VITAPTSSPPLQGLEDLGGDLHRIAHPGGGLDLDHAASALQPIGAALRFGEVGEAAAHPALDRGDGVQRVGQLVAARLVADLARAVGAISHHGGQQFQAVLVAQGLRRPVAHRSHQ